MAIANLRWLWFVSAALFSVQFFGCTSNQDDVCQNVGACSQAGDTDWISSCEDEAKSLQREASSHGCGGLFDDYYGCADANFTCTGITSSFPGCDAKRAALETCLSAGEAQTSCKELSAKTAACGAPSVDAGQPDADTTNLAPACSVLRDCEARCYLDHVKNPCAPAVDELSGVATCSNSCPP